MLSRLSQKRGPLELHTPRSLPRRGPLRWRPHDGVADLRRPRRRWRHGLPRGVARAAPRCVCARSGPRQRVLLGRRRALGRRRSRRRRQAVVIVIFAASMVVVIQHRRRRRRRCGPRHRRDRHRFSHRGRDCGCRDTCVVVVVVAVVAVASVVVIVIRCCYWSSFSSFVAAVVILVLVVVAIATHGWCSVSSGVILVGCHGT